MNRSGLAATWAVAFALLSVAPAATEPTSTGLEPAAPLTWGGIIDRIQFICTAYDPGSRRYRTDFGLVFGAVIAAFSLFAMAGFILREWIRAARTRAT